MAITVNSSYMKTMIRIRIFCCNSAKVSWFINWIINYQTIAFNISSRRKGWLYLESSITLRPLGYRLPITACRCSTASCSCPSLIACIVSSLFSWYKYGYEWAIDEKWAIDQFFVQFDDARNTHPCTCLLTRNPFFTRLIAYERKL